jgi:methylated-DNA-protein-cysteine methyltransferase related protein
MALKKKEVIKEIKSDHYFQRVYDVTSLIPKGRVSTYGAIADFLGLGSARMVGWALNHCHSQDHIIPAHRVVNRKGELSGRLHFQTPTLMQERLEQEGIEIDNYKVVMLEEKFWHPRELEDL